MELCRIPFLYPQVSVSFRTQDKASRAATVCVYSILRAARTTHWRKRTRHLHVSLITAGLVQAPETRLPQGAESALWERKQWRHTNTTQGFKMEPFIQKWRNNLSLLFHAKPVIKPPAIWLVGKSSTLTSFNHLVTWTARESTWMLELIQLTAGDIYKRIKQK